MATEIASLYASIGADTAGLHKGLGEASRALGETEKKFQALDRTSRKTDEGFKIAGVGIKQWATGLGAAMGVATAAAAAMKAAFDFTEQGASIAQTATSFDRLGLSLEAMRAASAGTVDDMTIMAGALSLVAGASEPLQASLLGSAPQLMEIAKAASALNPTLGDTAHMFESVALGIKRGSPMILDNLGIIVKVGEANEKYAAQLGKSVEALSAEERQIALLNGVLEAGTRLIEQNGSSINSATDAWAALRVEIKNTTDEMKANAAQTAGPVISRYTEFVKLTRENDQALIGFGSTLRFAAFMLTGNAEVMEKAAAGYEDYGKAVQMAQAYGINAAGNIGELSDKTERSGNAAKEAATKQAKYNDELERERRILEAMANIPESGMRELTSSIGKQAAALANSAPYLRNEEYTRAVAEANASAAQTFDWMTRAVLGTQEAMSNASWEKARAEAALTDLAFSEIASTLDEISVKQFAWQMIQQLKDAGLAGEELVAAQEAILVQFGLLTESEVFAQGAIDNLTKAFLDGKIGPERYAAELERIKSGIDNLPDYKKIVLEIEQRRIISGEALPGVDWGQLWQGQTPPVYGGAWSVEHRERQRREQTPPVYGGAQAAGGDYLVTEPTVFIAGEAGPERATFTPMGGGRGGGGGGATWNGDIIIQGALDPQATTAAVMRELRLRGVSMGGALR